MKPTTKRKARNTAILWTVIPVLWGVYSFFRISPSEDSSLLIMACIALALALVICVISWIRYATYDKKNSDHTTGGTYHE